MPFTPTSPVMPPPNYSPGCERLRRRLSLLSLVERQAREWGRGIERIVQVSLEKCGDLCGRRIVHGFQRLPITPQTGDQVRPSAEKDGKEPNRIEDWKEIFKSSKVISRAMKDSDLFCSRCGIELTAGAGNFYLVRIQAVADPTPPNFSEEDLRHDPKEEIQRLIEQMRDLSAQEAMDQIYRAIGPLPLRLVLSAMDRKTSRMIEDLF